MSSITSFWEDSQKRLGFGSRDQIVASGDNGRVLISSVWVNCTAFPSSRNPRAYTGYFESSSDLLNRIWYAGAYTLQLNTIDPSEGSASNGHNDENAPAGSWNSNFTVANGSSVIAGGMLF